MAQDQGKLWMRGWYTSTSAINNPNQEKTPHIPLPSVTELKAPKNYGLDRIYEILKRQNFYGVPKPKKNTIVVIISRNIFPSGSDQLTQKGIEEIKKLANVLKVHKPKYIEIKGYTDNKRLSSATAAKFIDNFGLSSARAKNAKKILLQYLNFDKKKISVEGLGSSRNLVSNETKAGRDINRRLEFHLYY